MKRTIQRHAARRSRQRAQAAAREALLDLNGVDLVRRLFSTATDAEAETLLYARTGFPSFWKRNAGTVPEQILRSLREYKVALAYADLHGLKLCDFCERFSAHGSDYCDQHARALHHFQP